MGTPGVDELREPERWFEKFPDPKPFFEGELASPHALHSTHMPDPPILVYAHCNDEIEDEFNCGHHAGKFVKQAEAAQQPTKDNPEGTRRVTRVATLQEIDEAWNTNAYVVACVVLCEFDAASQEIEWYCNLPDERRRRIRIYVSVAHPLPQMQERNLIRKTKPAGLIRDQFVDLGYNPHYIRVMWRYMKKEHKSGIRYVFSVKTLSTQVNLRWSRLAAEDHGFTRLVNQGVGCADDLYSITC